MPLSEQEVAQWLVLFGSLSIVGLSILYLMCHTLCKRTSDTLELLEITRKQLWEQQESTWYYQGEISCRLRPLKDFAP